MGTGTFPEAAYDHLQSTETLQSLVSGLLLQHRMVSLLQRGLGYLLV